MDNRSYFASNKEMDYFKKLFQYQTAEVREYWIVDPIKEMVMVYRFEKETMEEYLKLRS